MSGRQVIRRPYRIALSLYRRLPRFLRLFIVRRIAPGHTVGALCLIEHEGRLLMLDQHHRQGWTFPGGLINRGEDAEHAVVREVEEETGLRIEVGLPFAIVVDPSSRRVDVLYWVEADQASAVRASGEAQTAEWVSVADMGLVDEPTAQALAQFARFRAGASHQGRLLGP
jgi:ADP-ribose pyrophosphatase YjhB (NUDIX family)